MHVDRDWAIREDNERMAVRIASQQGFDADGRIRTRLVFHDDVVSNAILQVLRDNARSQIDAAAGGIRHDNSDCLVGECLRMRRCGDGDDSEQSDQPTLHEYLSSTSGPMMDGTRRKEQAHKTRISFAPSELRAMLQRSCWNGGSEGGEERMSST